LSFIKHGKGRLLGVLKVSRVKKQLTSLFAVSDDDDKKEEQKDARPNGSKSSSTREVHRKR